MCSVRPTEKVSRTSATSGEDESRALDRDITYLDQKNSTQNLLDYNLQLDGCPVTSSTVKYLGVILDSNLSFENHIANVTKNSILPS